MTHDQLKRVATLIEHLLETENAVGLELQGDIEIREDGDDCIAAAHFAPGLLPEVTTP